MLSVFSSILESQETKDCHPALRLPQGDPEEASRTGAGPASLETRQCPSRPSMPSSLAACPLAGLTLLDPFPNRVSAYPCCSPSSHPGSVSFYHSNLTKMCHSKSHPGEMEGNSIFSFVLSCVRFPQAQKTRLLMQLWVPLEQNCRLL